MLVDFDEIARRVRPEQLGQALGLEKKNGSFRCPYHDDSDPSLSIFRRDGRVSFKCHACDASGTPVELAARVWGADLPDAARRLGNLVGMRSAKDGRSGRKVEATYDYEDADGSLLFEVVRFAGKSFRQRRPDGDGGWIWNLNGVEAVPYRLPDVLEAVETVEPIWVVEGEKDVRALEREGVVATCNPGGAGGWRDEFAEHLRGADVTVVADADDAGRKHARDVGRSLVGVASSVRVVEPASGSDAADHLEAGYGLDEFVPFTSPAEDETSNADRNEQPREDRPPPSVRPLSEVEKSPDIPPGPAPKISADGRVVMVAGRDKGGKTTLVGAGISAVSLGGRFLGEDARRGTTLYVKPPGEGHPSDFRRVIEQFGGDLDQVLVMDRIMWPDDPVAEMEEAVRLHGPDLLVIDTLASTFSSLDLDPGRSSDWAPILNRLTDLAQSKNLAIILVHHARKSDGEYRDSTQIGANVDMILELHPVDGDDFARKVKARGRWPLKPFTVRLGLSDGLYHYRLVDDDDAGASLDRRVTRYVRANPGCSSGDVRDNVTGRAKDITETLKALEKLEILENRGGPGVGHSWHYVDEPRLKDGDDGDPFAPASETAGASR